MKAETAIGVGFAMFFAGLFVGRMVTLDAMPNWDWTGLANVALNAALVVAAFYGIRKGFTEWRRQFVARRDHDLAAEFVEAQNHVDMTIAALRSRAEIDGDDVASPVTYQETVQQYDHRVLLTRYDGRQARLALARRERVALMQKTLIVWNDARLSKHVASQLAPKEDALLTAMNEMLAASANGADVSSWQSTVLFSASGNGGSDTFSDEYVESAFGAFSLISAKLRMEGDAN